MNVLHHLWQSTLFVLAAWGLTLLLRKQAARVRYCVWLAASFKFLVPFWLLVGVGNEVGSRTMVPIAPRVVSHAMERMFVPPEFSPAPLASRNGLWQWLLPLMWSSGSVVVLWGWARDWRSVSGPGVAGIWRQRLVLPEGIERKLSAEELIAVLTHERCHMRWRDNLAAAVHMLVESIFWFHPLVWWMEKRLIEERERACDEEVLRSGSAPEVYASGILKVCEIGLGSRPACAAGITGADLKRRIEAIVAWRGVRSLGVARGVLLVAAVIAAVAVPIVIGADRLAFEVASVKRFRESSGGEVERKITPEPDGLIARRQSIRELVEWAYGGSQEITGPGWLDGEDYDLSAKAGHSVTVHQLRQMLQTLLADRFKLALHRETKTQGVYALVVGARGSKLNPAQQESTRRMYMRYTDGVAAFDMVANMERFAEVVSMFTDRKVIDQTGLTGVYQIALRVPMDASPFEHVLPGTRFQGFGATPGIHSAVEQFGLKLESKKAPVEYLVIDHIERPTEN
jgi:uncharacterized protein (TIGR03435 family)